MTIIEVKNDELLGRTNDGVIAVKFYAMQKQIDDLQKENEELKEKIERSFKIVDDKLTNLNLEYGINNEFREEYDELWEILKEN